MSNSSNDMALFQQFQAFKRMMGAGSQQGNQGVYPRSGQSGQRKQKQPYDPKTYDGKDKKSGAKYGFINLDKKTGEADGVYVMGWFKRKSCGFVQVKGFAKYLYKDSDGKEYRNNAFFEDSKGRTGVKMRFEVFYKDTGAVIQDYGFFYEDTGVVFLKNTGIIVCTKAPHGGTCGFFKKEENRK